MEKIGIRVLADETTLIANDFYIAGRKDLAANYEDKGLYYGDNGYNGYNGYNTRKILTILVLNSYKDDKDRRRDNTNGGERSGKKNH